MANRKLYFGLVTLALGATLGALVALNPVASVEKATASNAAATRQAIRQTPLLERPNRPGHFYGNSVRRLHHLRTGA